MDAVGHILAERDRDSYPWGIGISLALLLHTGIVGGFLLSSLRRPPRMTLTRTVAVRLLPAGSLKGGAAVEVPRAEPEKPKILKLAVEEEALPPPSESAKRIPSETEKETKPPPAASDPAARKNPSEPAPPPGSGDRGAGGPTGVGGNLGIGGATFDQADFTYSYYAERIAAAIGMNWFKPAHSVPTPPMVRFRIERDGTVSEVEIERSSGLAFVDRAALRAVLASSPLPPLPSEYGGRHVGVHVVFE